MNFLQMSFSGAVLIAAVLMIRTTLFNKLPKKTFPVLWELVLVRLLIPFSIPFEFSVYTLITALSRTETDNLIPTVPQGQPKTLPLQIPANNIAPISGWRIVWFIGMILCLAVFVFFYLRYLISFQASTPVHTDYVEQWLKEHPLKRPLSIRQSDKISAPLSYGIFRPVILMPRTTDWKNIKQLQYIFLHEYVHIRRFDTAVKLITIFALCVHWFNPFVWVMYILFNRDMELSCDESVIWKFGEASKTSYALMLINMEEKRSDLTPLCNNFSKTTIEERITAIMKTKKVSAFTIILACLVVLGISGIFATSAAPSANNMETAFTGNQVDSGTYAVYEPYGLTVDQGKLYYDGTLVRCFDDQMPAKGFRVIAVGYYEKSGTIDVRAVRENVKGVSRLSGLEVLSQEEFENKKFAVHSESVSQTDTNMFTAYENYGLDYDKSQKALFYDGKRVRLFWDSQSSDSQPSESESWFLRSVSNWDSAGEIDLYAVRDFNHVDENGYGTLHGFHIAAPEEFEANTKIFSNETHAVETAE